MENMQQVFSDKYMHNRGTAHGTIGDYNEPYIQNKIMEARSNSFLVTDTETNSHATLTAITQFDAKYNTLTVINTLNSTPNDINNLYIILK